MKKTMLIMTMLTLVIFASCQKEESVNPQAENEEFVDVHAFWMSVVNFDPANDPAVPMDISDVITNMNDAMNHFLCDPAFEVEIYRETVFTEVHSDNDIIQFEDVVKLFEDVKDEMDSLWMETNNEEAKVQFVEISPNSPEENGKVILETLIVISTEGTAKDGTEPADSLDGTGSGTGTGSGNTTGSGTGTGSGNTTGSYTNTELIQYRANIEQWTFVPSDVVFEADEALSIISAVYNYTECTNGTADNAPTDVFTINVSLNADGKISAADFATAYNAISDEIQNRIYAQDDVDYWVVQKAEMSYIDNSGSSKTIEVTATLADTRLE